MDVVVRKSPAVVVKPSSPMTPSYIKLSPYDMPLSTLPSPAIFLLFDHPIQEPTESIKRGLSQALVHYHAFAGRLAKEPPATHVRCGAEEEGVPFLSASANCASRDIKSFDQSLLEELAMYYPGDVCGHTDPLLMVQVTEFTCGGFVVGVTMNHSVADGYGLAQFLRTIGELARGLPSPSVVPVRWDASLRGGHEVSYKGLQPCAMALQDIVISLSLISMIKEMFLAHSRGRRSCTMYEAVAAVLWHCRTRAISSDPKAPTAILCSADVRKYVGAKDGYYGNCFTWKPVTAASGMVANGDIMSLIEMIQSRKDRDMCSLKKEAPVALHGYKYNLFFITSARNLGFEQADFGGGRPARVLMRFRRDRVSMPVCFLVPPGRAKVGGVEILSLSVKEEHAEAFLRELARLEPTMAKL